MVTCHFTGPWGSNHDRSQNSPEAAAGETGAWLSSWQQWYIYSDFWLVTSQNVFTLKINSALLVHDVLAPLCCILYSRDSRVHSHQPGINIIVIITTSTVTENVNAKCKSRFLMLCLPSPPSWPRPRCVQTPYYTSGSTHSSGELCWKQLDLGETQVARPTTAYRWLLSILNLNCMYIKLWLSIRI